MTGDPLGELVDMGEAPPLAEQVIDRDVVLAIYGRNVGPYLDLSAYVVPSFRADAVAALRGIADEWEREARS